LVERLASSPRRFRTYRDEYITDALATGVCNTPSTMQGEGLAHPLAFLLCLAVTVGVVWLWRRFIGP
jgi:hypothetical protein